jgi:hypothetical protein
MASKREPVGIGFDMRLVLKALLLAVTPLIGATPGATKAEGKDGVRLPNQTARQAVSAIGMSSESTRVAAWIASSNDNGPLPFIIVDKKAATYHVFSPAGVSLLSAPVLIGVAVGDDATPGVGAKSLGEIGPAERTTPAGRYLASFGAAFGQQKVLWIDYATSVALHPIPVGNSKERRRERMLSKTAADNRITFGCINVPARSYTRIVRPLFQKRGGYVYILPDTKPLEAVFPRLRLLPFTSASSL